MSGKLDNKPYIVKDNYKGRNYKMDNNELAIKKHKEWGGKIEIISRTPIDSLEDMAVAYTPGVAAPCLELIAIKRGRQVVNKRLQFGTDSADGFLPLHV